jgi:hypothetical protein
VREPKSCVCGHPNCLIPELKAQALGNAEDRRLFGQLNDSGIVSVIAMLQQLAGLPVLANLKFDEAARVLTNRFGSVWVCRRLVEEGYKRQTSVVRQVGVEDSVDHPHGKE